MKILGMLFIAIGFAILLFVLYSYIKESNKLISPVPEEKGARVIFATPTKE